MKMTNLLKLAYLSVFAVASTGCLVQEDSTDLLSEIGASTCISAAPSGLDSVAINFSFPTAANSFRIKRSGQVVFETQATSLTQFIDRDLVQGQTYVYSCEALFDIDEGFSKVGPEHLVNMEDAVAPTFAGITNVTAIDQHSTLVEWGSPSGSVATEFRVFKYVGSTSDKNDFSATPIAVVDNVFARSAVVQNLGDQITYSFRVVACNTSGICDDNDAVENTTLGDDGPPTTTGISSISIVNGSVHLEVPWQDSNGFVSQRSIYRAEISTSVTCPIDPTSAPYVRINDFFISDPGSTPTSLIASGTLNEGSRYCFIVRDQDPLGQQELNTNLRSIDIGDLTAPVFLSGVSLMRDPANQEQQIFVSWTAMDRESVENSLTGASAYQVFISSAAHPTNPDTNPCSTGTPIPASPVSAAAFPPGTTVSVPISGLSARHNQRVCVRAIDSTGNVSSEEPTALLTTGDVTPPTFSGIDSLSFNNALGVVEFTFVVPSDSDVENYQITTIRTRASVVNSPIVLDKNFGSLTPGTTFTGSFTLAEASLIDNDSVAVSVDACDNASPVFNSTNNCSSTASQLSLAIPDATPPQNFGGITVASSGSSHRTIQVNWNIPALPDRADYAGFRIYIVDGAPATLTELNSDACRCTGFDCVTNPVFSCEVSQTTTGTLLDPHRQYEVYVSAYDVTGNETLQYIPFDGGSAVTGFARANDSTAPTFNASFQTALSTGVELSFVPASDDQFVGASPNDNEVTYQIYRKDDVDFTDVVNPQNDPAASLLATVAESALPENAGRLTYTDNTGSEGDTYFYHACALDEAGNRTCQTGARAQVTVSDTTPPTINNYLSDKQIGNGTWNVTFTIADNSSAPADLIVRVFKSNVSFPPDTGAPTYSTLSGNVTVDSGTGATSFTDTGSSSASDSFYTITVTDQGGQKVTLQAMDMAEAPLISNLSPNQSPVGNRFDNLNFMEPHTVTINGSNFSTSSDPFGEASVLIDGKVCNTSSVTASQIICNTTTGANDLSPGVVDVRVTNGDGQSFILSNGYTLRTHCEIHSGSSAVEGIGTSTDPFLICDPDDLVTINDNNLQGYFRLMDNLDMTGSSFNGIRDVDGINFFFHGNNYTISNMTVDTFGTGQEAAFIANCNGVSNIAESLVRNINFDNATIRSGVDVSGGVVASRACGTVDPDTYMFQSIDISNSHVTGQPSSTSTGIAAVVGRTLYPTGFFNINISDTLIEAPIEGPAPSSLGVQSMGGLVGAALTVSSIGTDPNLNYMDRININNVTLDGRGDGINMGLIAGNFSAATSTPNINVFDVDVVNSEVRGSSSGNSAFSTGGAFGNISGHVNSIDSVIVNNTDILDVSGTGGGFVGQLNRTENLVISNSSYRNGSITCSGTGLFRGGFVGRIINAVRITTSDVTSASISCNGSTYVGGFAGSVENASSTSSPNPPTIDNSLVRSTTVIGGGETGGFAGRLYILNTATHQDVYITNNYFGGGGAGVSGTASSVGGFTGSINTNGLGQTAQISSNYYLDVVFSPAAWEVSGEIDPLTGAEFTQQSNFVGWDFTNIWQYVISVPTHQ